MESIIYKKYEENKGFEEYQAQIYNAVAKKYNAKTVTAEEIKKRLYEHAPTQDKNGITFAFDSTMKPLAYIQYREYPNEGDKVKIGFPWATDGTPVEVQDKLFYDLLNYLKEKFPVKSEFYLGFVDNVFTDIHASILNRYKFSVDFWLAFYAIEQNNLSEIKIPSNYSSKVAFSDDLQTLIDISLTDDSVSGMGAEDLRYFLKTNVFTSKNADKIFCLILLKDNKPVGTMAILNTEISGKAVNQGLIIAIIKGEEKSFEILLALIAKEISKKNWIEPILVPIDRTVEYQENILKNIGGTIFSKEWQYKLSVK